MSYRATDLAVVIPTRERWGMLERCLDALSVQTAAGAEVIVVADGTDQRPDLGAHTGHAVVDAVERAGPGVARNAGVGLTRRPLVLLLGDDIMADPGLVASHLGAHNRRPERADAVLGSLRWHPDAASGRIQRWLDWSGTQFDFGNIAPGSDAGWARFYSSNVSFKKELFDEVGGFDPDFRFLYEDIELGWRLGQAGMRLWFEPSAVGLHLHRYDWPMLRRRFETAGRAERLMVRKHPWFEPWFRNRCVEAVETRPPRPLWPLVVDALPPGPLRRRARGEANRHYHRLLGPFFLNAWDAEEDLDELRLYLGDAFDPDRLHQHKDHVEAEEEAAPDETTFYRTSQAYLYDLTAFGMWGTKIPYRSDIRRFVPPAGRLLDYGCGIGTDGLRLSALGYRVDFADFDNPSTRYLRWRLERRGLSDARVYDIESDEIGPGYDLAYSFDVIEHVEDPFGFLERLEAAASLVAVNLLEFDPDDTHLHRTLPIGGILDRAERQGIVRYRRYHHGRSHFVVYGRPTGRLRSRAERWGGALLSRRLPGLPPSAPAGPLWD